jgi:hypothetical protein
MAAREREQERAGVGFASRKERLIKREKVSQYTQKELNKIKCTEII